MRRVVSIFIAVILLNIINVSSIDQPNWDTFECNAQWTIEFRDGIMFPVCPLEGNCCDPAPDLNNPGRLPYCEIHTVENQPRWSRCIFFDGGFGGGDDGPLLTTSCNEEDARRLDVYANWDGNENVLVDEVYCVSLNDNEFYSYCETDDWVNSYCYTCGSSDEYDNLDICKARRHCPDYPGHGLCERAYEYYEGDNQWSECSYNWTVNTQEICGDNLDNDCDGSVDEGCISCIEEGYFCTDDLDGCCPGLECIGSVNRICATCSNEGDACEIDYLCCGEGLDGGGYCSSNHCCPVGTAWNSLRNECQEQIQCYGPAPAPCNIRSYDNFIRWLTTPGCFRPLNQQPTQACCPAIQYGQEGYYFTDIVVY